MIKKLINEYLKSMQIQVILRSSNIEGVLSFYQIDFLDCDDKYHSFLFIFTETRLFGATNVKYIGTSNNLLDNFDANHRVFDTQEGWVQGRFPQLNKRYVDLYCNNLKYQVTAAQYGDFKLDRIELSFNPVFALIVWYQFCDNMQKPLILVCDQVTDCTQLYPNVDEFHVFLEHAGLQQFVSFGDKK